MNDVQSIILSLLPPAFSRRDLNFDVEKRENIERHTRDQAQLQLRHIVRAKGITASLCGRILCPNEMTPALLKAALYPHHFEDTPNSIQGGRILSRRLARNKYARRHGKKN